MPYLLATTEKHKIIPTILSRCQILTSRECKDAKEHLAEVATSRIIFEDDALHIIAQKADGAMRDALSILIE
jgi:DNA polymerase-3 subunit gamma/tau